MSPRISAAALLLLLAAAVSAACEPAPPAPATGAAPASASRSAPSRATGASSAAGSASSSAAAPASAAERARQLARRFLIVDGHIDLPNNLDSSRAPDGGVTFDVAGPAPQSQFDYPRARAGGLDAPFMAIYVSAETAPGTGRVVADRLIDHVERIAASAPDKLALAASVAALEQSFATGGKIALLLGIENGTALDGKLDNVAHFYRRGVRYLGLAHSKDNDLCDSSYDQRHTNGGLTALGRQVVAELNRRGMMVDVAHVSDESLRQILELSATPVIASHSACRRFTPGWERNLSDDLIRAIAQKGGVVMINFGSGFIDERIRQQHMRRWDALRAYADEQGLKSWSHPKAKEFSKRYAKEHGEELSTVERVADHIDHVRSLAGIDHLGFGSDFDGLGETMPPGLADVSGYPNLIRVLLERGYSEADIEKICSGNLLRVWRAVEVHAASAPSSR